MKEDLLRFDNKQKYLIFDTETEGLNLVRSRPFQVSWIIAQGKKILERNDRYVFWSDLQMSDGAAKITKFNKAYYTKKAEDPKDVWDDFSKELYNPEYKILGQNLLGFDVYVVNTWRKAMGLNPDYSFVERIIDTLSLERAIQNDIKKVDFEDFTFWQYRWINFFNRKMKTSQGAMLKKYGIDHDPKKLHDALYDIEMNFEIFKKQVFSIEV